MADKRLLLVLNVTKFITILLYVCEFSQGIQFTNENGVVTPRDPFKFLGETLILDCNITNDNLVGNSKDLYFERQKGQEKKELDRGNLKILTTKSVRLRLPNVGLEDDGIYTCKLRTYNKPIYIGHQVVKVDYKPSPIYNVSCQVMNWESMTCNWILGVAYQHLEDIKVDLVWTVDLPRTSSAYGKQEMCPQMSANYSSCTWTPKHYLHNHKYFMKVIVQHLRRNESGAMSPQFNVETRLYENSSHVNETGIVIVAMLEPAPVNNFMATVENSHCIALAWQHSSKPERKKVFIIQYKSLTSILWENHSFNPEAMNTTVCGLLPDLEYTFRIKVMPYPEFSSDPKQRNGFSSPWKTVLAKTEEDVPEESPLICPSCFYEHPCHPENDTQCPLVTVYWKDIPTNKRNGRITGYQIAIARHKVFSPVDYVQADQKMIYFANVPLPSKDMEYTLAIKGRTRKGYSKKSSQIVIPSRTFRPTVPDAFLVQKKKNEEGQDKYYLLWEKDNAAGLAQKKIIILWCFGTIPDFICKGNIHWISLSADKVNHIFTPQAEEEAHGNLIFGIAREVHYHNKTYSSGIQWATCIYTKDGTNPSPPRILSVTSVPKISGLTVTWEKDNCPKDLVYIERYGVSLCQTENGQTCVDENSELVFSVNNTDAHFTFPNLEPNVKYMVQVWAESYFGDGARSSPKTGKVEEISTKKEVNPTAIVFIVVLVAVVLLILLICIVCACRYIKNRRKRLPTWSTDIPSKSEFLIRNMHHVQNRPLPAVPREDPQYGANACMKSPGSDYEEGRKSSWSTCNGINATISNTFIPPLCHRSESTFGDETTCQPLIPRQNDYETNFSMHPLPNANTKSCEIVEADAYETPVSGTNAGSYEETFRQTAISDPRTSLTSGISSGDSSYIPNHSNRYPSTTDVPMADACIFQSESPPLNVAPLPPCLPAGKNLPYNHVNEQLSESHPSASHLHSIPDDQSISLNTGTENVPQRHPRTGSDDRHNGIVIMMPSCIVSYPKTEVPHSAHNPRGNPLHDDCLRHVASESPGSLSDGHSDTSDSSIPEDYSRLAAFETPEGHVHPDFHAVSTNSNPLRSYVPNGYMYPTDAPTDILLPNGFSRDVPSDMSDFPETSNFYPASVSCDSCDHHGTSIGYSTFAPCNMPHIIQTPNGYSRISDIHVIPSTKSNGHFLPNEYLKCVDVPNRKSITFNDLNLPPPPAYPPTSSETVL